MIINHNSDRHGTTQVSLLVCRGVGVGGANEQNTMSEYLKNPRGLEATPVPHLSGVLYGKG